MSRRYRKKPVVIDAIQFVGNFDEIEERSRLRHPSNRDRGGHLRDVRPATQRPYNREQEDDA